MTDRCANLPSEGLDIVEYITSDTQKKVGGVIRIPKHLPKLCMPMTGLGNVLRILVELTPKRLNTILDEPLFTGNDWSQASEREQRLLIVRLHLA